MNYNNYRKQQEPMKVINNSNSSYADDAQDILDLTGYNCSKLNWDQMDKVGMAFEQAYIDIERGQQCEGRTDADTIGAYVGGAFETLRLDPDGEKR